MPAKQNRHSGFTIIELLLVTIVISILATLGALGYNKVQENGAKTAVLSTIRNGSDLLEINFNKASDYPPNLAGTEFVTNDGVQTVLYTNAPYIRKYTSLTADQNAQLLLNSCRAHMPITHNGSTYSTGCAFAGVNFHIKGQRRSNVVLHGPTITNADFAIDCSGGAAQTCIDATEAIKNDFIRQGGTWPVTIPRNEVPLPEPDQKEADEEAGAASRFCFEARHDRYAENTVFHIMNDQSAPSHGACPSDPALHYIPEN